MFILMRIKYNRKQTFPTNIKTCGICDVTSGVPWKACWGKFSIAIYGNVLYIQTAAAFPYRGILSYLDADPEFQHQPF